MVVKHEQSKNDRLGAEGHLGGKLSLIVKKIFFLRDGGKHQWVVASQAPPLGTWPTTQACARTGN